MSAANGTNAVMIEMPEHVLSFFEQTPEAFAQRDELGGGHRVVSRGQDLAGARSRDRGTEPSRIPRRIVPGKSSRLPGDC